MGYETLTLKMIEDAMETFFKNKNENKMENKNAKYPLTEQEAYWKESKPIGTAGEAQMYIKEEAGIDKWGNKQKSNDAPLYNLSEIKTPNGEVLMNTSNGYTWTVPTQVGFDGNSNPVYTGGGTAPTITFIDPSQNDVVIQQITPQPYSKEEKKIEMFYNETENIFFRYNENYDRWVISDKSDLSGYVGEYNASDSNLAGAIQKFNKTFKS